MRALAWHLGVTLLAGIVFAASVAAGIGDEPIHEKSVRQREGNLDAADRQFLYKDSVFQIGAVSHAGGSHKAVVVEMDCSVADSRMT